MVRFETGSCRAAGLYPSPPLVSTLLDRHEHTAKCMSPHAFHERVVSFKFSGIQKGAMSKLKKKDKSTASSHDLHLHDAQVNPVNSVIAPYPRIPLHIMPRKDLVVTARSCFFCSFNFAGGVLFWSL